MTSAAGRENRTLSRPRPPIDRIAQTMFQHAALIAPNGGRATDDAVSGGEFEQVHQPAEPAGLHHDVIFNEPYIVVPEVEKTFEPEADAPVRSASHVIVHLHQMRVSKMELLRQCPRLWFIASIVPDDVESTVRIHCFNRLARKGHAVFAAQRETHPITPLGPAACGSRLGLQKTNDVHDRESFKGVTHGKSPSERRTGVFATSSRNSRPTRATTSCQFPNVDWRNRRAVGYQGLSSRSSIQRQSGELFNRIQTGLPMARARWATEVSMEITRPRLATIAAVSAKSFCSSWRSIKCTRDPNCFTWRAAAPNCNE